MSTTKNMPLNWYSSMKKKLRKIRIIFDIENWLWKSEIGIFRSLDLERMLIWQNEKVLFFTQLSYHLMRKLMKNSHCYFGRIENKIIWFWNLLTFIGIPCSLAFYLKSYFPPMYIPCLSKPLSPVLHHHSVVYFVVCRPLLRKTKQKTLQNADLYFCALSRTYKWADHSEFLTKYLQVTYVENISNFLYYFPWPFAIMVCDLQYNFFLVFKKKLYLYLSKVMEGHIWFDFSLRHLGRKKPWKNYPTNR